MVFTRFGGDRLSHVLRRSTIGATALNGRVRNGSGCIARAMTTKPSKNQIWRPRLGRHAGVSALFFKVSREPAPLVGAPVSINTEVVSVVVQGQVYCVYGVVCLFVCNGLVFCATGFWLAGIGTLLLLDQIKPIGPLVPVS